MHQKDALRSSEARLLGILDIAADAIISIDEHHRITLYNQGAESIFGYTSAQIIGKPLDTLLPERFRHSHAEHICGFDRSGAIARRMGERGEVFGLRKDGTEFSAEASISKLELGGTTTFTVVLRDITERVEREKALRYSEERLSLAMQAGQIGFFEIDQRADTLYWSPTYRQILGVTGDERASMETLLMMVPPDDRSSITQLMRQARDPKADGHYSVEHRIVRADGTTRWLAREVHSQFEGEGDSRRVARTIGVVRDITDRKQLEVALEHRVIERTAELSALVDALPDGIVHADVQRRLRTANSAMTRLFGFAREEFEGMTAAMLFASQVDSDVVENAWVEWESGHPIAPAAITCRRKDGTTFPALVLGNVVRDGQGGVTGRVGIIRDITEDLKRQRALAQAQRMEAFGQLTGGIAHDFNNLLTVISGNQELLDMRLDDEKSRALLKRAQEAADMGARLTARLLTFARRRQLEPTMMSLNVQIAGMAELLQRSIGEQITLKTHLAPSLGPVRADASEIENALLNLVINGRDAMPSGGTIIIETAEHVVDGALGGEPALPPGQYIRLSVTDSGTGMPPDIVRRAFEPFFTTKQPGKGTGLGLSTIHGFAQQSGGTATIYSEVGRGTTVNIYLPRVDEAGQPLKGELQARPVPASTGETVLLVEDNPAVREVAQKRLQLLGYKVIEAENGPEAIERLERRSDDIDVVFSDVVMPGGLSGYDLAGWMTENAPDVKVLLTSGYPGEVADARGEAPTVRLLRKPYSGTELARALRAVLDA